MSPSHPVPPTQSGYSAFQELPFGSPAPPCLQPLSWFLFHPTALVAPVMNSSLCCVCVPGVEELALVEGLGVAVVACPCSLGCTVSLPCAGYTAVLHRETPHGDHHHHPAGIREVPRRGLQVRTWGWAGEGEGDRMRPCSTTGDRLSCQSPRPGSCCMASESPGSPKRWGTEVHCPQTRKGHSSGP